MVSEYVPVAHARDELKRIDAELSAPHLLIGGLAVQQYYQPRTSEDIDLVCPADTAAALIETLYPTYSYNVEDKNDDVLRPAWVVTQRGKNGRTTFIGPKITERLPYQFVDYGWLLANAVPYRFSRDQHLTNIRVPILEAVAFLKILSLAIRLEEKPEKGEQDLRDFINLTNLRDFKPNVFLDLIEPSCEEHLATRLIQINRERQLPLFADSTIARLSGFLLPSRAESPGGRVCTVYSTEDSLNFYAQIADHYDSRNTRFLYEAHQEVISQVRILLDSGKYEGVLDVGCGTGRLVAAHFAFRDIEWVALDGCEQMLGQFAEHVGIEASKMKPVLVLQDLMTADFAELPEVGEGSGWIALVSFVLTSLPNDDVIEVLLGSLPGLRTIVIADIHPIYTTKNPDYDFSLPQGDVNLKPRPVFIDILQDRLQSRGFRLTQRTLVRKAVHDPYAFVYTFDAS